MLASIGRSRRNGFGPTVMSQQKQREWLIQWKQFDDDSLFLFEDWIYPNSLESFRGKDVLDAGCGGGQHINFIAPYARSVTGVDLNTAEIAREKTEGNANVAILEGDIAEIALDKTYDIVLSIGVIHHTDNPDKTVENLKKLV